MKMQLQIIGYIKKLSAQINKEYNVHPNILVSFGDIKKDEMQGYCTVLYNKRSMSIEISLSWIQPFNKATITSLTVLLIHEYAHYLWGIAMSSEERVAEQVRYDSDDAYRRYDEYRTWKQTRKMIKNLGLWNTSIEKEFSTFMYAGTVVKAKGI